jgi:hypothetical protein
LYDDLVGHYKKFVLITMDERDVSHIINEIIRSHGKEIFCFYILKVVLKKFKFFLFFILN